MKSQIRNMSSKIKIGAFALAIWDLEVKHNQINRRGREL